MTWKRILYILAIVVVAGVSALSGGAAGGLLVYRTMKQDQSARTAPPSNTSVVGNNNDQQKTLAVSTTEIETTITQAVQKVGPAVVTVVGKIPGQPTFFGFTGDETVSGSGVFISDQGYILTNNHVVDSTKQLQVILSDGSQEEARIVGTDRYSDIAILKVNGKVPAVAALGNSDVLKPGETVIAIGSPLGDFKNTVTVGVVSATERSIDTGRGYQIEGLIQTDAAINQGNSGGPLVNLAGEVIGINTLIVRNTGSGAVAEGLGFAIPINAARAVAQQIIDKGYFARPYMGISFQPVTPDIAAAYHLGVKWGAYVSSVAAGSPADRAGVQRGDIITKLGGVAIDENHPYINTLYTFKPGDQITLEVYRDGKIIPLQITLGETSPNS